MAINKKAMFFTLTSILLVGVFVLSFSVFTTYRTREKMFVIESRVKTMNNFITGLEQDVVRGLKIASVRALLGLSNYITSTGEFLNNSEEDFKEALLNGTLYSEELPLTTGSSIKDWIQKINAQAQKVNIILDYNITNIVVNQSDPWNIDIYLQIDLFINDTTGIASWEISEELSTQISITGYEDPVYLIGVFGKTTRTITPTNFTTWNINNLKAHLNAGTYRAYSSAPSFLMRLEGNLSASPYGIETLVDTNELIDYEIPLNYRSSVAYIYWGNQTTTDWSIHNITDDFMPDFKLDQEHVTSYNVESSKY
ncbi:hypothetical protein KY331_03825 [Candidatus Woesearchaeota archaeon]|nr:hypothetical protein [Candidatus Woesearchaeota archaeon]